MDWIKIILAYYAGVVRGSHVFPPPRPEEERNVIPKKTPACQANIILAAILCKISSDYKALEGVVRLSVTWQECLPNFPTTKSIAYYCRERSFIIIKTGINKKMNSKIELVKLFFFLLCYCLDSLLILESNLSV